MNKTEVQAHYNNFQYKVVLKLLDFYDIFFLKSTFLGIIVGAEQMSWYPKACNLIFIIDNSNALVESLRLCVTI